MRCFLSTVVTVMVGLPAFANPPDATLDFWLRSSNIALAGEVLSEPKKVPFMTNLHPNELKRIAGFTLYSCRVKVTECFQHPGTVPPKEIEVFVRRYEDADDEVPQALRKGSRCIFFLNWCYAQPPWVTPGAVYITSDTWFGVHRYNGRMAALLKAMGTRPVVPHGY
jgi:hypothetical protein